MLMMMMLNQDSGQRPKGSRESSSANSVQASVSIKASVAWYYFYLIPIEIFLTYLLTREDFMLEYHLANGENEFLQNNMVTNGLAFGLLMVFWRIPIFVLSYFFVERFMFVTTWLQIASVVYDLAEICWEVYGRVGSRP